MLRSLLMLSRRALVACLVGAVIACGGSNDATTTPKNVEPSIEAVPQKALVDEKVSIRLSGFTANETVTLKVSATDDAGAIWQSEAQFRTDDRGSIDVAKQAPETGSYAGVDAMGLFWSMRSGNPAFPFAKSGLNPVTVNLVAEVEGLTKANATLERLYVSPDVIQTPVQEASIQGILFAPKSDKRLPAVIVVGGSEGGIGYARGLAPLLASHGLAALALPYFNFGSLPQDLVNIPIEYFESAITWLQARPEVNPDRIAVVGVSRGGELALLLGSLLPQVKAVVGYVPSNVAYGGLQRAGQPGGRPAWTFRGAPITANKVIEVEKTNGPILVISGTDDKLWPSTLMSDFVVGRLKQLNFPHKYVHLSYTGAGHTSGFPYIPTTGGLGQSRHPISGNTITLGGNAADNAKLRAESWPQVISFLSEALK